MNAALNQGDKPRWKTVAIFWLIVTPYVLLVLMPMYAAGIVAKLFWEGLCVGWWLGTKVGDWMSDQKDAM